MKHKAWNMKHEIDKQTHFFKKPTRDMLHASCSMLHDSRGQLLIEAMIAMGIVVVGTVGVLGLLSQALSLNRAVSNQFVGTYLAAEGIEVLRNILDANLIQGREWNSGFRDGVFEIDYRSTALENNGDRKILFNSSSGRYGYESGEETPFVRTVRVKLVGQNEVAVNSIVSWTTRGSRSFEVNLEDHFFSWRR